MKLEPQILHHSLDAIVFGVALIKLMVAFAIVIALLSLLQALVEARRRRGFAAAGWLAGAAIVAAIVAAVLVGSVTAAYA